MKLRNKKTGEIKPAEAREDGIYLYDETTEQWYKYELDLLAKWWEYYEEPKEYWYIDTSMMEVTYNTLGAESDVEEFNKQIGNYFETKEEAEKAVEKLKAYKRLRDKGFEFIGWQDVNSDVNDILFEFPYMEWDKNVSDDLDLLFGDEK